MILFDWSVLKNIITTHGNTKATFGQNLLTFLNRRVLKPSLEAKSLKQMKYFPMDSYDEVEPKAHFGDRTIWMDV